MEINEKIHIEEYNPGWISQYEYEKEQLCNALGYTVLAIEHIGSTAIPGIWAKPIVDIMIGVKSLPLEEHQISKLMELGYENLGEAGVSGRIYFPKRYPKAYNVHVTQFGNLIWKNNILLRDFLSSNRDEAMRYSELKKSIISEGVDNLLEYSECKADFINEILRKASDMKKKVAFVCVHNSCRSQMAEGWARKLGSGVLKAYSAGTENYPEVKPLAVQVMEEAGVDMSGHQPKLLSDIPSEVDILITMGCNVECPNVPCQHREDWGLSDPSGGPIEDYRKTRDIIKGKVEDLIHRIKNNQI